MIKVAISGFGRIGRAFFRIANQHNDISISHINDIKNFETLAYLLKNDSLLGKYKANVKIKNNKMLIENKEILLNQPLENIDVLLECSGTKLTCKDLETYLKNGVKKVILSAPPKDNMPIFVLGVNENQYQNQRILSNASCSSNAITPILKALSQKVKILGGNITTIHPFNSDQVLLDNPHPQNNRLSRNATQNIIPIDSSIGKMIELLFQNKVGRFYGNSIRIPTSIVSFSEIVLLLEKKITKEDILNLDFNPNIIGFDDEMLVSSDFIGDSRSAIIPTDLIQINNQICKISIWFDNESAYANRLLDMTRLIAQN